MSIQRLAHCEQHRDGGEEESDPAHGRGTSNLQAPEDSSVAG